MKPKKSKKLLQKKRLKKIFVTGGGGYIGVILVEELLKKGYQVKVCDAFYWGKEVLDECASKYGRKLSLLQKDVRDINKSDLVGVDAVIHQAALSNDPMANYNPEANFCINTEATIKLAKLCKRAGISRFTFASSASIYDENAAVAIHEKDELSKVFPEAAYSLSKHKAEEGLINLADKKFCPVILRQGTVYGYSPRMRYDLVVNSMFKSALVEGKIKVFCGGKQWRPLVAVKDVALAHIRAIEAPEDLVNGQIFNVVYKNYQVYELAEIVRDFLKEHHNIEVTIKNELTKRKDRNYLISGKKIKESLNWQPTISVDEEIKNMFSKLYKDGVVDCNHPKYYNIEWMQLLLNVSDILKKTKKIF